jgi:hypothetical protein
VIFFVATAAAEVVAATKAEVVALAGSLGRGKAAMLDTDPLGSLLSTARRLDPGEAST